MGKRGVKDGHKHVSRISAGVGSQQYRCREQHASPTDPPYPFTAPPRLSSPLIHVAGACSPLMFHADDATFPTQVLLCSRLMSGPCPTCRKLNMQLTQLTPCYKTPHGPAIKYPPYWSIITKGSTCYLGSGDAS